MPLGVVSDEEFVAEKENASKPFTVVDKAHKGRSEGDNNVPDFLRNIISETSVEEGRQSALGLATKFGVSPSSVSAYAHGANSTASYNTPNNELKQHINQARHKVTSKARAKLLLAMKHITEDKLEATKARDLAGIAKDMSTVMKNMEDKTMVGADGKPTVNYVFFAPQVRTVESFGEVIQVNENG